MFGKNGYISFVVLMSFLARIMVLLSDRGLGKSHGFRKFLLKHYLLFGHRFVCLYRTKNDRDAAIGSWLEQFFNPPGNETFGPFNREDFKWRKAKNCVELYYKNDKTPIGYFLCIAHINAIKQMVFPDSIRWGWWDEILPEAWTKLPGIEDEGLAVLKIMDTIEHDTLNRKLINGYPRVRWMFFGNISNLQSPILQFLGISPFKYGVYRGKLNGEASRDVIIERIPPVINEKLGDYSNAARIYTLDNNEMAYVCSKTSNATLKYSLRVRVEQESKYYHFYINNGVYWINQATKHKGNIRRGTVLGKRPDEVTLQDTATSSWRKYYIKLYANGYLYFNSPYTKLNFINDLI